LTDKARTFQTDRTRHFRTTELNESDERTIRHIEQFGCSVVSVKSTSGREYNWSYTIGVHDTCGKPDLIVAALNHEVAHACLNEAAERLRAGIDLKVGRHSGLIGDIECEFRPIDPKWVSNFMNWAVWYYDGTEFPVLQVVYPDVKNRFPEDDGFNEHFAQPMMRPGAPWTRVEEDFWAANDPKSSLFDWKFPDPPHTGVYLSKYVHEGTEQMTFVSHDPDGDWQFVGDTAMGDCGGVLVCFHHPIDRDPTLKELADLPIGWYAERDTPDGPWHRHRYEIEEDDAEPEG
jgi:hypothetical protein